MGFDKRLFRSASWVRETTSYISPIINQIDDPSSDVEAGQRPGNNQGLTEDQERDPLGMEDETDLNVANDNESMSEESVTLPRRTKVYFYTFYVVFLLLYIVLVLITTCKYPLKPEYYLTYQLPIFGNESVNITDQMKQSVYLNISFDNRNTLASVSYDDLNISLFYLDPRLDTSIYVASNIDPGFSRYKPSSKEVNVYMRAPELPGLLQQLQKDSYTTTVFRVNMEITVKFRCRFLCRHKYRFHIVEFIDTR